MAKRESVAGPRNFFALLPDAFLYPFRGHGKFLLLIGGLCYWFSGFMAALPLLGLVWAVIVGGYVCAVMIDIIGSSAKGDQELLDWPDFRGFWSDILHPLFLVVATAALCFLPAIVLALADIFSDWDGKTATWIALAAGMLYLPMGLLAVALCDSVAALNPFLVVTSILKVPVEYLTACVALGLIFALRYSMGAYLTESLPIFGSLVDTFVWLYFLVVEMRIIGLIYYAKEERLGWF